MRRAFFAAFVLLAVGHAGCTFYTACPAPGQTDTPGTGGAAGSSTGGGGGATSNGGTTGEAGAGNGDTGGSAGTGGSSISFGGADPSGEWLNETFNLAGLVSECGNLSFMSAKPDEDLVIVGVAQRGLFKKTVDASAWSPLGQGKGSAVIRNRMSGIVYDPEHPRVFWESGLYNLGGVYRTDDGGDTFVELPITHSDGVSIDFSDPDRQTLLATGHEQDKVLNKSTDGGESWTSIGERLPSEAHTCPHPLVFDADTYLLGCGTYGGGKGGLYRTVDGGDSWDKVEDIASGAAPLRATDGTLYWASEGDVGLLRSDDDGQTWEGPFGGGQLYPVTPVELPDHRLATLGAERVLVSSDRGETWTPVSAPLPYVPVGFVYAVVRKAFYVWRWTCTDEVPDDGIMAYDFDWQAE